MNINIKKFTAIVLMLLCALTISGCNKANNNETVEFKYTSKEEFIGKKIAIPIGTTIDLMLNEAYGEFQFLYYEDIAAQIEALRKGDVDAICSDSPVAGYLTNNNSDLTVFPDLFVENNYSFFFQKGDPLQTDFCDLIEKYYNDGTISSLEEKWLKGDVSQKVIDWETFNSLEHPNGTLNYYFYYEGEPLTYIDGSGLPCGYEIDLILKICTELGYDLEFYPSKVAALIMALDQGKADFIGGTLIVSPERLEMFDAAPAHYHGGIVMVINKDDLGTVTYSTITASGTDEETEEIIDKASETNITLKGYEKIINSFRKTFIVENRWKLIVNGIETTLLITLSATFFGSILGILLFIQRKSLNPTIRAIGEGFCSLIAGIPGLVVLLIIYFVILGSFEIPPVVNGIITFTILFAVPVSSITKSGFENIDIGQYEAGRSIGLSRFKTNYYIISPQVHRNQFSLYIGEIITMMKLTSIVSYVAISDLTKAGDIIRSRTYEAFFPLVSIALIYFILSRILIGLLSWINERFIQKKRKTRLLKGIDLNGEMADEDSNLVVDYGTEIFRLENISKKFGDLEVIKDISTTIKSGEIVSIIGPSGSGKSTILRMLNKLETPTSGKIYFTGTDVSDNKTNIDSIRSKATMVFQNLNLFNNLSVIENVMLGPVKVKGIKKQAAYNKAIELLRIVGIADKAMVYPEELSGGQKQRVAIARALAMDPYVVLLDEPTSALDPTMVDEVIKVIKAIAKRDITMIIVTHEMRLAKEISTRVLYIDQGEIYEEGSAEKILDNPDRYLTKAFISKTKVLSLKVDSINDSFIDALNKIRQEGIKNRIPYKTIDNAERCFEEIVYQEILNLRACGTSIFVYFEFDENNGKINMKINWQGNNTDPLLNCENTSVKLVKSAIGYYHHSWENNTNELNINIRQ